MGVKGRRGSRLETLLEGILVEQVLVNLRSIPDNIFSVLYIPYADLKSHILRKSSLSSSKFPMYASSEEAEEVMERNLTR